MIIVAISVDDEADGVSQFAKQHGARFSVAWDPDHKTASLYKPQTMPSTFVIDRSGFVRSVIDGYREGDKKTIEDAITSLL